MNTETQRHRVFILCAAFNLCVSVSLCSIYILGLTATATECLIEVDHGLHLVEVVGDFGDAGIE